MITSQGSSNSVTLSDDLSNRSKIRKMNGNGSGSHTSFSRSSSSSLFLPRSINPDTFTPRVDIIFQVSSEKEKYTGDKSLSISQLPLMIKVNIDRLRPHMKGSPGVHPILAASLFHGIVSLSSQEEIRELIHLKNRFDSAPMSLPGIISATLANFLSRFKVDTPVGERFNFFLPPNHHALLSRIGRDLGVSIQALSILSVIHTLSTQPLTNSDDRKEMERILNGFVDNCRVRARGAKALMREFSIPEVEEKRIEELEEC